MTRGNILLVDDDPGFLTALTKTLTKRGYVVTAVANALGVVEEMSGSKQKFDLVITDLSMPHVSGFFILSAIKAAFPGVAVIVITAFGDEETRKKALCQGAFAFVPKPLNTKAFFSLIDSAKNGMSDQGGHSKPARKPEGRIQGEKTDNNHERKNN